MAKAKKVKKELTGGMNPAQMFDQLIAGDKELCHISDAKTRMFFPTGIDILDYKMGKYIRMNDGVGEEDYIALGPNEGSIITIIGDSGSGKSTVATQIAANMVAPFPSSKSWVVHFDEEEAGSVERVQMLHPEWTKKECNEYYKLKESGISVEQFYMYIDRLSTFKTENPDMFNITAEDTDMDIPVDREGNPITFLAPTIIILDSLAVLQPNKIIEKTELGTEMSTTSTAKAFASLFRSIRRLLKKANINVIVVNHLLDMVSINPYESSKAMVNYLPAKKTVYGGKTPVYLSNFVLLVEPGAKIKKDEGFGFDGYLNTLTLVKNRANKAGQKVVTVFSQEHGIVNHVTNYHYVKTELKRIKGAGVSFYLDTLPDVRFSQKKFLETYNKNEDFAEVFDDVVLTAYEDFVYIPPVDENEDIENEIDDEDDDIEDIPVKAKSKKASKKNVIEEYDEDDDMDEDMDDYVSPPAPKLKKKSSKKK